MTNPRMVRAMREAAQGPPGRYCAAEVRRALRGGARRAAWALERQYASEAVCDHYARVEGRPGDQLVTLVVPATGEVVVTVVDDPP